MKNFNQERLVELKNEAENILVVFSHTVHHVSKFDIFKAIQQLANGQVEMCKILMEVEDRRN